MYVVDCCFAKTKSYNAKTGVDFLTVMPVSQASATQRAGRAGRVRPGKAYRLCTEASFETLRLQTVPELQRSDLSSVVLQLKALGVSRFSLALLYPIFWLVVHRSVHSSRVPSHAYAYQPCFLHIFPLNGGSLLSSCGFSLPLLIISLPLQQMLEKNHSHYRIENSIGLI